MHVASDTLLCIPVLGKCDPLVEEMRSLFWVKFESSDDSLGNLEPPRSGAISTEKNICQSHPS